MFQNPITMKTHCRNYAQHSNKKKMVKMEVRKGMIIKMKTQEDKRDRIKKIKKNRIKLINKERQLNDRCYVNNTT